MVKKKANKTKKAKINEFSILHPNAAGIDVSSKDHVVAVPPGRAKETTRTFGCFTCDLENGYHIKKIDISANAITVDGNGSETIDDGATAIITTQYECITVVSDGTEWWIV